MDRRTRDLMFSSKHLNAITPQDFYDQLDDEFEFELDLAADEDNNKCKFYYDEATNALEQDWAGHCWCNPPYGRGIGAWVDKAAEEDAEGEALIVMLLPARTDTKWFKTVAKTVDEIRFVEGRLRFEGNDASAPFPSMVAIWYGNYYKIGRVLEGKYKWNLIWRRI